MAFVDLLENFFIRKSENRDKYYEIRDELDSYKSFIYDNLGYKLIVKEEFIKLEKIPAIPEQWMGFKGLEKKKEYIFFILLIMFLEDKNKEEQFILSNITEYIEENYNIEKIDWTIRLNRIALINVLNLANEIGIINKNDGEENEFIKNEGIEVLYENTGISRYVVRSFNKDISECKDYKDLLIIDEEYRDVEKGDFRRQRVYRRLLLSPAVYRGNSMESDYEYIKNYRSHISNNFEKYLGWSLHSHKNFVLNVVEDNSIKDSFPNKKSICNVVLFLSAKIRLLLEEGLIKKGENELIVISRENFHNIILALKKEKGIGFSKDLRDASDERFIYEVEEYLYQWLMIYFKEDSVVILPLMGKFFGAYPNDYDGGNKDE